MVDIFKNHNQKKKTKDTFYLYFFYTILPFTFALLLVFIGKSHTICLTEYFCADSKPQWFKATIILYLYILIMVVVLIQTYKLLEKLAVKQKHILYFKYIMYALPFLVALTVWLAGIVKEDAYLMISFTAILSVLGLLMIEFRKKK